MVPIMNQCLFGVGNSASTNQCMHLTVRILPFGLVAYRAECRAHSHIYVIMAASAEQYCVSLEEAPIIGYRGLITVAPCCGHARLPIYEDSIYFSPSQVLQEQFTDATSNLNGLRRNAALSMA